MVALLRVHWKRGAVRGLNGVNCAISQAWYWMERSRSGNRNSTMQRISRSRGQRWWWRCHGSGAKLGQHREHINCLNGEICLALGARIRAAGPRCDGFWTLAGVRTGLRDSLCCKRQCWSRCIPLPIMRTAPRGVHGVAGGRECWRGRVDRLIRARKRSGHADNPHLLPLRSQRRGGAALDGDDAVMTILPLDSTLAGSIGTLDERLIRV